MEKVLEALGPGKSTAAMPEEQWKYVNDLRSGSFGIISLWKNQRGTSRVIKQLWLPNDANEKSDNMMSKMSSRWECEVEILSKIDCDFIVKAHELDIHLKKAVEEKSRGCSPGSSHARLLCMEYCGGGDLKQLLEKPENASGLSEPRILKFLDNISQAIQYLHDRKIIHRDIKPANILVEPVQGLFKLSDLGFAKKTGEKLMTCSSFLGTLQYLAPEVHRRERYDEKIDLWSFGIVAYEVICGNRPFLMGEPSSTFLPFIENKSKSVITIYRNPEDGSVNYSDRIEYNTKCSELIKYCLEKWLQTMLQTDPSIRGKAFMDIHTADRPIYVAWKLLHNILKTNRVQVYFGGTSFTLSVGEASTIRTVQYLIQHKTSVPISQQLLITLEGDLLYPEDLAVNGNRYREILLLPLDLKYLVTPSYSVNTSSPLSSRFSISRSLTERMHPKCIWAMVISILQKQAQSLEVISTSGTIILKYLLLSKVGFKKTKIYLKMLEEYSTSARNAMSENNLMEIMQIICSSTMLSSFLTIDDVANKVPSFFSFFLSLYKNRYEDFLDRYKKWQKNKPTNPIYNLVADVSDTIAFGNMFLEIGTGGLRNLIETVHVNLNAQEKLKKLVTELSDLNGNSEETSLTLSMTSTFSKRSSGSLKSDEKQYKGDRECLSSTQQLKSEEKTDCLQFDEVTAMCKSYLKGAEIMLSKSDEVCKKIQENTRWISKQLKHRNVSSSSTYEDPVLKS